MENKKPTKLRRNLLTSLVTLTVLVAVLAVNIGFTWLSNRYLLRVDMSTENFNEISAESKVLLDALKPEDNNITIYFLADPDELRDNRKGYANSYYEAQGYAAPVNNLWGMKYVYDLALEFANAYSFVNVKHLSLSKDAEALEVFRSTMGAALTKQDVIVDNYTSEKDENGKEILDENGDPIMHHNFRIVKRDAFFAMNSETSYAYAFQGDLRFTSTILSLSGKNPTVYFITGHGEAVGDYTPGEFSSAGDYGEAQALRDLFFDAGFVTKKINLAEEYETLFADDSARIVVLYGPQTDFTGDSVYADGGISEITVLRQFLIGKDHHMMVFMNETEQPLSNLEEYLYDYWGVDFADSVVKDSGKNSLSADGLTFFADYETDEFSIGINLTDQLFELDSLPRAAFSNARPITFDARYTQSIGYSEMSATLVAGPTFLAPAGSTLVNKTENGPEQPVDKDGTCLAGLTYETFISADNEQWDTYVFSCGGTGFVSNEILGSTSYANRDVLFYTMRLMSRDTVPFNIDYKELENEGLSDLTEETATAWTIVLCSLIPTAMLIMGTVVFVKRRHS